MALREAREQKNQALVQEAYTRQWRDACDDARVLDSAATNRFVTEQRAAQLSEKQQSRATAEEEESAFLAGWKEQLNDLEKEEIRRKELRSQAVLQTKASIQEQVSCMSANLLTRYN
jgi:hypothetical protein